MIIFNLFNYLRDFYHNIYLQKKTKSYYMCKKINQEKCPYCGGFLNKSAFYRFDRYSGSLYVWICPNCKKKVSKWLLNH